MNIQSDYSVSQERQERAKEQLKQIESEGHKGTFYLPPDSYQNAADYLGAHIGSGWLGTENPLSFKESQSQTLASQATAKMRDFADHKSFSGYSLTPQGFMGEDFLQIAKLPSHYQIHSNALQAFNDYFTTPLPRGNDAYYAEFVSLDLIAGISYANTTLDTITNGVFGLRDSYSKGEILQMFKGSEYEFLESDFDTPLMRDYQNAKGEFRAEGILLMFAFRSDSFAKAQSPLIQLSEYGKSIRGLPNSSNLADSTDIMKSPKSPEEIKKENRDILMEYYLQALNNKENGVKEIAKETLKQVDDFVNTLIRRSATKAGMKITS